MCASLEVCGITDSAACEANFNDCYDARSEDIQGQMRVLLVDCNGYTDCTDKAACYQGNMLSDYGCEVNFELE